MSIINETAEECLTKWGVDLNTRNLLEKIEKCLELVEEEQEKRLFLRLLTYFNYYSMQKIHEMFIDLNDKFRKIEEDFGLSIFMPIMSPKGRFNNSYDMVSCYQRANNMNKNFFPTEMNEVLDRYPLDQIKNIVFLDDIIGTGRTIGESLKYMVCKYPKLFEKKKIYLIVIEATDFGIANLQKVQNEIGLPVVIIYGNLHKKAFEDDYIFPSSDINKAKEIILKYEAKITRNNQNFILGFEQSESLMAFYYDTPNNTLSSFWFENTELGWTPIFPRRRNFTQPGFQLKQKKKTIAKANYLLKKESGKNSGV